MGRGFARNLLNWPSAQFVCPLSVRNGLSTTPISGELDITPVRARTRNRPWASPRDARSDRGRGPSERPHLDVPGCCNPEVLVELGIKKSGQLTTRAPPCREMPLANWNERAENRPIVERKNQCRLQHRTRTSPAGSPDSEMVSPAEPE
jgi:hypothetical protein